MLTGEAGAQAILQGLQQTTTISPAADNPPVMAIQETQQPLVVPDPVVNTAAVQNTQVAKYGGLVALALGLGVLYFATKKK